MKKIFTFTLSMCMFGWVALRAESFIKVTDVAALQDGNKVILGCAAAGKVSGGFQGNKESLVAVDATFADDTVKLEDPTYLTLKANGNHWNLFVGTKPIGHKSGYNKFDSKQETTTNFAIGISAGTATMVSQTPGSNSATVAFYYNTSNPRFGLYASGFAQGAAVALYVLDETSVPEIVPMAVDLDQEKANVRLGSTLTLSAVVTPEDAVDKSVTWGSTDTEIATVADGVVTPVALGTAKIWVKTNTADKTDTCVVRVLRTATTETATYNAVQKAEYMAAGDTVFFGTSKAGENYVMGQYVSGNNIKGVAANYGEERHSVEACLQYAYRVEREGDYYLFVDHDGNYLRTIGGDKLGSGQKDQYAQWALSSLNEDDATIVLTASNGLGIYNNHQSTNDMFRVYEGVGDGSNLAKIILYSSAAPTWTERVPEPWIKVDTAYLDWGQQEPDDDNMRWGDSRKLTVTVNDLPADAKVELVADTTFYCGWTEIKASRTTPAEITVYWQANQAGVYTGNLIISCPGVDTVTVGLHAEAIGQLGPVFSVSVDSITFELNEENDYIAEQQFFFSASHLKKSLYCKWEHTGRTLFQYEYQNKYVELMVGEERLYINSAVSMAPDSVYDNVKVSFTIVGQPDKGVYPTKLHFYSYKADSHTELAIDKTIPVVVYVDTNPDEAIDRIHTGETATKILRDGKLLIIRGNRIFDILGIQIR